MKPELTGSENRMVSFSGASDTAVGRLGKQSAVSGAALRYLGSPGVGVSLVRLQKVAGTLALGLYVPAGSPP